MEAQKWAMLGITYGPRRLHFGFSFEMPERSDMRHDGFWGVPLGGRFGDPSKSRLTFFFSNGAGETLFFFANRVLKGVHVGPENWSPFDSAEC